MAKKEYATRYKTPEGTAIYPWLNVPDEFKGKKQWKVNLALDTDSPECQELMEQIDELNDAAFAEETASLKKRDKNKAVKYEPYEEEYDDQEELTGRTIFKFRRLAAFMKDGEERPIYLNYYDANGKWTKSKDLEEKIGKIGFGSKIQVEYETFAFYNASSKAAGVTLRLIGVKVNECVTPSGGVGNDWDGETSAPTEDEHEDF